MQMPLSLARREYISKICDLSNNSGLPCFVMVDILKDVLSEMRKAEEEEYKRDMALYRKSLSDENKEGAVEDGDK